MIRIVMGVMLIRGKIQRALKEKTARVGSGHSKFGFYWFFT
jgi:hypothetical protein